MNTNLDDIPIPEGNPPMEEEIPTPLETMDEITPQETEPQTDPTEPQQEQTQATTPAAPSEPYQPPSKGDVLNLANLLGQLLETLQDQTGEESPMMEMVEQVTTAVATLIQRDEERAEREAATAERLATLEQAVSAMVEQNQQMYWLLVEDDQAEGETIQ